MGHGTIDSVDTRLIWVTGLPRREGLVILWHATCVTNPRHCPSNPLLWQPPSQALVSVFMQAPNLDRSLANATESLAQNNCKYHSHRDIWSHRLSRSVKSSRLAVVMNVRQIFLLNEKSTYIYSTGARHPKKAIFVIRHPLVYLLNLPGPSITTHVFGRPRLSKLSLNTMASNVATRVWSFLKFIDSNIDCSSNWLI